MVPKRHFHFQLLIGRKANLLSACYLVTLFRIVVKLLVGFGDSCIQMIIDGNCSDGPIPEFYFQQLGPQFLIQRLASYHRVFRDLAVNPIAVALIRHMVGERATRFSSHNSFVKWQGDFGYGKGLGLHADQTAMPLPWGRRALTANANWCLTNYTHQGGAFAWVPGSHKKGTRPGQPSAARQAVAVEAPKGSLLVFHGATWHGAYPRLIPGMRLSIANYYRHAMVTSQEDIQGSFDQALSEDCDDPELFRVLAGFGDEFPYREPNQPVPSALD